MKKTSDNKQFNKVDFWANHFDFFNISSFLIFLVNDKLES